MQNKMWQLMIYLNIIEEDIFHIINHCKQENLKFDYPNLSLNDYSFKLKDLKSRLKTFIMFQFPILMMKW